LNVFLKIFFTTKINKQRGLPPIDEERIRIEAPLPFFLVSDMKKLTRCEEH